MKTKASPPEKTKSAENASDSNSLSRRKFLLYGGVAATAFAVLPQHMMRLPNKVAPCDNTGQTGEQAKVTTGAYNVKDFGATGDSKTLDMQAINKTIEACSAIGGGTVMFPAGVYLTGTIHLKSNITLDLSAGATILGSKDMNDYEEILDPWHKRETEKWHTGLVEGNGLHNIAIIGHGTIDGNKVTNPKGEENYRGPHAILLNKCDGILVRDILIRDAGNYGHQMENCSNGNVRGVTVTGGSDGIDLFNCKDFIVTDCHFMTGDDCVAGGAWERVVVSNCTLNTSCSGFRNYNGGLKNVLFTNLVIAGPGINPHIISGRHDLLAGFLIISGLYSDEVVDNLIISNISVSNARCPLWMGVQNLKSSMRNVMISNLTATSVGKPFVASLIQGSKENPVENISLNNITIVSEGGGTKDLIAKPFPITVGDPIDNPEVSLPCYGLFCRNIKDLDLRNIRFSYSEKDARPALICDSIGKLDIDGVHGQPGTGSESSIVLRDIKTLISHDVEVLKK